MRAWCNWALNLDIIGIDEFSIFLGDKLFVVVVVVAAGIRSSYFYVGGFLLPKGQFQVSGHILWSLPQISDCQGCRVTEEEVANIMWSPVVIFTFVLTYSWFGYTVVARGRRFSATMEL
uniref:Uncharacterized protein n=1 Tax=Cacopsylla melanoneura TaxID=428564 RepID=A0A8D8XWU6_9HEMI